MLVNEIIAVSLMGMAVSIFDSKEPFGVCGKSQRLFWGKIVREVGKQAETII